MFTRASRTISRPPFVVDHTSLVRDTGRQIDWDLLDSRYESGVFEIEVTADADIDDTSLAVVALPKAVPAGATLDFGIRPAVTVTLSGNEAIGQTDIGIAALSAPLRAGTILKSGAGEFMQLTADAQAGATSLTVEALEVAWESGDTATVPAERIYARVTADAQAGATSLTVEALDAPIDDGELAYLGDPLGGSGRQILAGTIMDLLASGKIVPSAMNSGGGVTAYGILETNADEDSRTDAATGYGVLVSGFFYENLLPEADGASPSVVSSTWKTELLARGGAWMFTQYEDGTNS